MDRPFPFPISKKWEEERKEGGREEKGPGMKNFPKTFFRPKKRKDGGRKEEKEEGPKANFFSSSVLAFSRLFSTFLCLREAREGCGRKTRGEFPFFAEWPPRPPLEVVKSA